MNVKATCFGELVDQSDPFVGVYVDLDAIHLLQQLDGEFPATEKLGAVDIRFLLQNEQGSPPVSKGDASLPWYPAEDILVLGAVCFVVGGGVKEKASVVRTVTNHCTQHLYRSEKRLKIVIF